MKILIVSREYPPETGWGGIATLNYHLAKGLQDLGHEVDVLSFDYTAPTDSINEGIRVIRITSDLKKLPWETSFWFSFYRYQAKVFRTFRALHEKKKYDVVDCTDHLGEGYGIIKSKMVPTCLRCVCPWSWMATQNLNYKGRWYDVLGIKWLERKSIEEAHCLNSPSRDMAVKVSEFFNVKKPIEIIENPIDSERFSPGKPIPDNPVKVLFLGRLEPRKGPDILAHAIPLVRREVVNVEFTFLGADCPSKTSSSTREEIRVLLKSSGDESLVAFHDPVPLMELPTWYNSAHIIVVPSRYDTSPYVCQEAMSCGKAVVGTSSGGMAEYLDEGRAGLLVPPENPGALARAIITLCKDAGLRKRLGEAARNRVLQRYSRTEIAGRMCKQYMKALDMHRKAT